MSQKLEASIGTCAVKKLRFLRTLVYQLFSVVPFGGAEGSRTPDLDDANVALYQLSYDPIYNRIIQRLPLKVKVSRYNFC